VLVEFVVAVMEQILGLDLLLVEENANAASLLRQPVPVRRNGYAAQVDPSRFEMDKEQNKAVGDAELGEDFTRDEVAGPDGLCVALQEAGPIPSPALRCRFNAVFVEDSLDGCASDFVPHAEFGQLAMDAGVAPGGILLSQADDQLAYVLVSEQSKPPTSEHLKSTHLFWEGFAQSYPAPEPRRGYVHGKPSEDGGARNDSSPAPAGLVQTPDCKGVGSRSRSGAPPPACELASEQR